MKSINEFIHIERGRFLVKVLFNADDFGLSKGVTDGIIKSHLNGVVGATTLMMNGEAVEYAINQAKQHPSLDVGVHLVLTTGRPILTTGLQLVQEDGFFKFSKTSFNEMINIEQVEREWRAQINLFLESGLSLHHIDSHHHVHGWPVFKNVMIRLGEEYQVPIRAVDSLKDFPDLLLTETLYDGFYEEGIYDDVFTALKQLQFKSVEVMTHPAKVDYILQKASSYVTKRQEELDLLCNLKIPDWIKLHHRKD